MSEGNASEYMRHTYKSIRAGSYAEAVTAFFKKYGYTPAPVFGPPGCGDALESKFVPAGYYFCAVRQEGAR